MYKPKLNQKPGFVHIVVITGILFYLLTGGRFEARATDTGQEKLSKQSYISSPWNKTINETETKEEKYPDKKKITPETIRLTINEYYIPELSELLDKGVDYLQWLNQLDDPYLNRYKVDIRVDPADERLKVFWKRDF